MKKIVTLFFLFAVFSGTLFIPTQISFAQAIVPTPTLAIPSTALTTGLNENQIAFKSFGLKDSTLHGPYDSLDLSFSTPVDWQLTDGAQLELKIDARFFKAASALSGQSIEGSGATIDVTFNDIALTTILIDWSGEKTISIPIPANALTPYLTDGRHSLTLFLDAAIDCFLDFHETTVVVRSESKIILPHSQRIPNASLSIFPRPLYLPGSFFPTPVKIIVPEDPTSEELQAAMTVSGGLGRLTNGNIPLSLTTPGKLSNEDRLGAHLIYVGKASSFSDLNGMNLPASSNGNAFASGNMSDNDGVIQVINSPFTDQRLLYVVGGNSDIGVIKAAQALSSGSIRTTNAVNLAVITDVQQSILSTSVAENRTLRDLGYQNIDISGIGIQTQSYQFYVPLGQMAQDGGYFDLIFNHSALLDYERSGIVVLINDQTVGAVKFSDQNTSISTVRIGIPAFVIRPGSNILTIEADMAPSNLCSEFISNGIWTSIVNTSLLHLPLATAVADSTSALNLTSFPHPFISSPTLSSLGIVLPKNDPVAWNVANKIVIELGSKTYGNLVNLKTVYDTFPEDQKSQYDLLIVGKANNLPIIIELNSNLPAPFENGSNVATERGFPVVYRIPEDSNLGYLQWLPAPWDKNRTILAVMGTSDIGLEWASNAITKPELRSRIGGDFVVARDTNVLSSNSRFTVSSGLSATLVPAEAVNVTPSPIQTTSPVGNPVWIIPAIIGTSILIAVVFIFVFIKRKS